MLKVSPGFEMDSFTDTNEYGEGTYGGNWPGISGTDKKMFLEN